MNQDERHRRAHEFRERRMKIMEEWKALGHSWPLQSEEELDAMKAFFKRREREDSPHD